MGAPAPAVFVSDYLPDHADEGRKQAQVVTLPWPHNNYAGFITIDKPTSSNTFFWFFESMDGNADAPILLWLQGGPGVSSMFGLFTEVGPFNVGAKGELDPRDLTWNKHFHLLFLDNPLGTGFSFTNDASKYVKNQTQVGDDLYSALSQFFQLFPMYRLNPFYVTGESYAGKYVPSCTLAIHMKNQQVPAAQKINLQGMAIGDGAMDPPAQFKNFGELLWYLGMVDETERAVFANYESKMQAALSSGDLRSAFQFFDEMLNGDFYPYPTYYANVTGMKSNYFNFALSPDAASITDNYFIDWLQQDVGRNAVHVGAYAYNVYNSSVEAALLDDWMRGVVPALTTILEANYKVLVYSGQNDIILGPPLTEQFLFNLSWSGQAAYQKAPKATWSLTLPGNVTDLAGYVRQVKNFTQVVVRGAGHMVPGDQPERGFDLITRWVNGLPFSQKAH